MDSADLLSPNILRRTDSNESFARTGAGSEDADAKLVRNSFIATHGLNYRHGHSNGSPVREKETANGLLKPQQDSNTSSETSTKTQSLASSASSTSPVDPVPVATKMTPSNSLSPRVENLESKEGKPASLAVKPTSNNRLSTLLPVPPRLSMHSSTEELSRLSLYDGKVSNRSSVSTDDEKASDAKAKAKKEAEEAPNARQRMSKDVEHDYFSMSRASQSAPKAVKLLAPVSESGSSDDDDDVPPALQAQNGFPNRSKTPDARLSQMPAPSARPSAIGPGTLTPRSTLPPFARNLPDDPYRGDMMNGSRESLLLNRQSMYPPPGVSPVPGVPPGGLVGVIAEEERVKSIAIRN